METYTKYEIARILGARALQLSMNAPILVNIPKEKLEEVNFDPLKIAEIEFNSGILPITIKRPFPRKEEKEKKEEDGEEIIVEEEIPEEPKSPEEKIEEKVAKVKENKKETETEEEADEEEEEKEVEVEGEAD